MHESGGIRSIFDLKKEPLEKERKMKRWLSVSLSRRLLSSVTLFSPFDEGVKGRAAALDYACGSGLADCAPVQPSGICYLPNTLPSHVSYAFNSYYQRSNAAAGACDFGGTATVTVTDPSYGSCTFPSSARYVMLAFWS
ncbi:hypothetical protein GW17_00043843 [Ensete ventricosum]|nr:hypothetical protein GW17_00043843 [Ensete ventricosum]